VKHNLSITIPRAKAGLTLLAALSITLLCTSPAEAATTKITNGTCPVQITAPGDYTLDTDVGPCVLGTNGINISAANVTLHLNGHSIEGAADGGSCFGNGAQAGYYGILIYDASAANVIGPGEVHNFFVGVGGALSPGSLVSFIKTTAGECPEFSFPNGFDIGATEPNDHWTLVGNVTRGNSFGMNLYNNFNNVVGNNVGFITTNLSSGNIIAGNNAGIHVFGGSNNQILSNRTEGTGGIALSDNATDNLISLNVSLHNSVDMFDTGCGINTWVHNEFKTANKPCIH
jgi:hypothetical protein